MPVNRTRLQSIYNEEYLRLNEKQRMAVDSIEGPVMVIAGPGTGKTQILACRIGKILLETDTYPSNILCLTFTDAGVVAMRKRLLRFIGPDAYKVNIYTFHAFCNDVIQENLSLFEKTALDPISELEKIELFKRLIDAFPKNHPLKRYRGDVYFEVNNLQNLFSTMKKEGWSPLFINQKIDEYIHDLPNREEFIYKKKYRQFNAGDLKQEKINDEKEKMEKLRAAVNEFENFQQLMRKRNRYDYDDMINWVIRAFEENKSLLSYYQEKYQYILVDEYQDTSGTQNKLVQLLVNYWEKPNVFVVGDDDQSIFRFQGANVENMMEFADSYKNDLLTVVLTHNYRSTQPILDISKTLISRNEERLVKKIEGLSKELQAANEAISRLKHPPLLHEYETEQKEMMGIARQVKQLVEENVSPGRIAVIYKENKYGEELGRYFKLMDIPVYSKRHVNILELPLAKKIIQLLKYLAAEHDVPFGGDEMLFEILHYDWFGIQPIDIAKLSLEAADRKSAGAKISLRQLLNEKINTPPKDLFSRDLPGNLRKTGNIIETLISQVPNCSLQQLFENMIRLTGILGNIINSPDKHWQLQVLTGLFDFVKEETHRDPSLDLQRMVKLIMLMEDEGITLPLIQVSGSEKGINLLTVHGSKGLEFEYVYLAGSNAGYWEKKRKPPLGFRFPDTMFSSQTSANDEEELRRLFYVALTRAEQHLIISFSKYRNDGRELEPSMFIAEIQDHHPEMTVEHQLVSPDDVDFFSSLQFRESAPEIEKIEEDIIGQRLEKFVMNVTALNNFLRCPLEFYFKNLIRIPSPKNEATEFGSAVHFALEKLFRKMQASSTDDREKVFPPVDEFIADFAWYMHRHRESFTKEQFDRRMEYGLEVLPAYYNKHINQFKKTVTIERNIQHVVVRNVPLKGKLDKMEFEGNSVNVVDYKTGDPQKAVPKLRGPGEKDPLGGDYWRQAVFYKILVDNYSQKNWQVASTEFDFIEPDSRKIYHREKIFITPADIDIVTGQLVTAWEKIQGREFYTGCGKENCHWCNFVKTNDLAIALHEMEEEEEP